jgi:hypothetical protein
MSSPGPYSSDNEEVLALKVAAAAAQHELGMLGFPSDPIHRSIIYSNTLIITFYVAKALLRAKRKKRSRDDDSSEEDTVSLP